MRQSFPIQFALMLSALLAHGQGTFIYDQQSATNSGPAGGDGGAPIHADSPMGQSFTPSLSGVGFVQMKFNDAFNGDGVGASVYINLRADSITGPILGSTAAVFMPDRFSFGITNLFFTGPIAVAPGTTYFLEPVIQSFAGNDWGVIVSSLYNYPGGTAFFLGNPDPTTDLWFREGILAPEPSSAVLVLLAGGIFSWRRLTRSKNRSIT